MNLIHSIQYRKRLTSANERTGVRTEQYADNGPPVPCSYKERSVRTADDAGQYRTERAVQVEHEYVTGLQPRATRARITLVSGRQLDEMELVSYRDSVMLTPGYWMQCELRDVRPGSEAS